MQLGRKPPIATNGGKVILLFTIIRRLFIAATHFPRRNVDCFDELDFSYLKICVNVSESAAFVSCRCSL